MFPDEQAIREVIVRDDLATTMAVLLVTETPSA